MPFKSLKQEHFLFAKHPDIAQGWANEAKGMATTKSFANMLNQKPTTKTVTKESPKPNLWAKMLSGGK